MTESPFEQLKRQQREVSAQLFPLIIKDLWLGSLYVALNGVEVDHSKGTPWEVPDFEKNFLGAGTLNQARHHIAEALGEPISDDRLKELVEEVLCDELDKYELKLVWRGRHNWDGNDRVLAIFKKDRQVESTEHPSLLPNNGEGGGSGG